MRCSTLGSNMFNYLLFKILEKMYRCIIFYFCLFLPLLHYYLVLQNQDLVVQIVLAPFEGLA